MSDYTPPPIDAAVLRQYQELGVVSTLTSDMLDDLRRDTTMQTDQVLDDFERLGFQRHDVDVLSADDSIRPLTLFSPPGINVSRPCVFFVHGGGMISGNRFSGIDLVSSWALDNDAVVATPEYRLAPEFPDPYPVDDAFAALTWVADNALSFGIDPDRIVVVGASAGGGIAAGVVLLARDTGGPRIHAQMLLAPMLDDRGSTVSSHQIDGIGFWDRSTNEMAWTALLSERRATADVSIYAAPARATNLADLPKTFIDVGSAEVFRDEAVNYALGIWQVGGDADLHVWAGGIHGYDSFAPSTHVAKATRAARETWIRQALLVNEDSIGNPR